MITFYKTMVMSVHRMDVTRVYYKEERAHRRQWKLKERLLQKLHYTQKADNLRCLKETCPKEDKLS